ncbi:MAG TPA: PilZ domain-containing protein [Allosphingosinicella sp.]|jgi:hypothetical protein
MSGAMAIAEAAPPPAVRDPRTKVLLTAQIIGDRFERAVRIRNMSASGAMLEGTVLPAAGARLILARADLRVEAEVVWSSPGRCGIRFAEAVAVPDWISGTAAAVRAQGGQARIDALQADIRAGFVAKVPTEDVARPPAPVENVEARLAEEVAYLRRMVQTIGEELSDEPIMLHRYLRTLQQFDVIGQALGHVAAVLTAEDKAAAVQAIGMQDMRARLLRKAVVPSSSL